jgi:murein DD-endopeptidase MepM/ murein hydrolase activator NlpD
MPAEKWTFLIVKDEESPIRQVKVARGTLRVGLGVASGVAVLLTVFTFGLLFSGVRWIEANRLAQKNQLLEYELAGMRTQVADLEGRLSEFSQLDRQMRVLAGLDPIDSEVLEVGIGGPGTLTPEALPLWSVDSTLTKETFAVSYDLNALERRASLLGSSFVEVRDSLESQRELLLSTPSILPAVGWLSSSYSRSRLHPLLNTARPHQGIDISAPRGTPIMAAAAGRVRYAARKGDLGLTVEIDHGYGYVTRYGHASKLLVRAGQQVARGDLIAQVGSTGLSTSTHVHYEVLVNGRAVNPMNYVVDGPLP